MTHALCSAAQLPLLMAEKQVVEPASQHLALLVSRDCCLVCPVQAIVVHMWGWQLKLRANFCCSAYGLVCSTSTGVASVAREQLLGLCDYRNQRQVVVDS